MVENFDCLPSHSLLQLSSLHGEGLIAIRKMSECTDVRIKERDLENNQAADSHLGRLSLAVTFLYLESWSEVSASACGDIRLNQQ
jgi:hypothetical protein